MILILGTGRSWLQSLCSHDGIFEETVQGVVISGHMLGLDLEREELRVRAVSY